VTDGIHNGRVKMKAGQQIALSMAVNNPDLWPTPTVAANYNRKGLSPQSGDGLATAVTKRERGWPTPNARDWKDSTMKSSLNAIKAGHQVTLGRAVHAAEKTSGGSLNPMWVEWLMGWPLGWTDLNASETDKCQQWLHSHGKS
jgi:hypothetical protein